MMNIFDEQNEDQFKINDLDFIDWVNLGITKGWISPGFCYTHDGDPYMTDEEEQDWNEGGDPCFPVFKYLGNS